MGVKLQRAAMGIAMICAAAAAAEDEWSFSIEDVISSAQDAISQLEDSGLDLSVLQDAPSLGEWNSFWTSLRGTLDGDSLQDLAWMKPYAQGALSWLDSVEGGEPYADWLRQRLDYFEVADEILRETSVPAPPPPPSQPRISVPRPRPPAPVDTEKVARAEKKVSERDTWRRKLANRPPPRRAAALVPGLRKVFRDEGLPDSLVWMAEVESTFDPEARSPVGAVGLYQLMPATAERFGLRLTPRDERHDPEKNARAAAKYLKFLHREFDSWPLAIAAYNAGEGRVRRTLRKHGASSFDDISRHLPAETRLYVPKVLTVIELRDGKSLAVAPNHAVRLAAAGDGAAVQSND